MLATFLTINEVGNLNLLLFKSLVLHAAALDPFYTVTTWIYIFFFI